MVSGGACGLCQASFYNNGSSEFCTPCAAGEASAVGAYSCVVPPVKCSNGLYYSLQGRSCTLSWTADVYCNGGQCLDSMPSCSSGLSSTWPAYINNYYQHAATCTGPSTKSCPPGTGKLSVGATGCYACQYSQFNDGSSLYCANCPVGSIPSSDQTSCVTRCAAGKSRIREEDMTTDFLINT